MISTDAELVCVAAFLCARGWGARRIAEHLQVPRHRVHRLLAKLKQGEEAPACPTRAPLADTLAATRSDDGD